MYRPSKHLVVASEDTPAIYRPSNQLRLVPARPANPQLASSMLPGMGNVQSGNGVSSLGLQSKAADRRLAHAVQQSRAGAAIQQRMAQRASGVAQPMPGALQVSFSWAADSIAATRQKIIDMYGLQPIKGFGSLQTYVTTAFGSDMEALQDALCSQPIVKVYDVQPYIPQVAPTVDLNAPQVPTWEHVRTQQRPDGNSRWITTKLVTPSGTRFAVTLYRTEGGNDTQVVRSDNLATDADAAGYIKSYEVKTGDIADAGHAKRTVYWNSFLRGNQASGQQVDSVNGKLPPVMLRRTAAVRDVQPMNGLGELAKSPLVFAAFLFAGVYLLAKHKPSH